MKIRVAFVLALMGCLWILCGWVNMRFWLYHRQNLLLNPEDYDIQVLTAAEYHRLTDRNQETVTFDDGSTTIKAPAWYDLVLPNYKQTLDGRYVLVSTKGTAHMLFNWETGMFPLFVLFGALVLILGLLDRKKSLVSIVASEKQASL